MSISGPLILHPDDDECGGFDDPPTNASPDPEPSFLEYHDDAPQPTVQALQNAINEHARQHGYALSRTQGKKDKRMGRYRKYILYCDRGGAVRLSVATLRNTSTRKTGCLYQCIARRVDGGWRWEQHSDLGLGCVP
ncbi:hypothetical protein CONLIGDRAFT_414758 [Coniochaeta ligniaria NRRL 30616]|uniref:FAR1 domain-containing protein n=1 Tax=Coniochaeta ligniaria NRRL 30616 TaxID=1408157 RepID=A0A1J7IX26_9PEZI|nr:hypothetical protein CONLIGDRAFT_414758 [Coniochaeta ligniaria NRRL 30616]